MTLSPPQKDHIRCRIICIGNALFAPDSAGPRVHQLLSEKILPPSVELIDGGLGGLNLLSFLEHIEQVIFIDAIKGFDSSPGIKMMVLPHPDIDIQGYDHNAGIGYLMTIAPQVLDCDMPECLLVGIEGAPTNALCRQAADFCLELILQKNSTGWCVDAPHAHLLNYQ